MKTIKITERPDLKTSEIMALLKQKFKVWSYYDDKRLDKEFPAPKEATIRHFLAEQEPDKETLGMSASEAERKGFKNGITLRERMLLEIDYFDQTGSHLDIKGVTFCSGSRSSDGDVPGMDWDSDDQKVRVSWYDLDRADARCGVRSAVTLNTSSFLPLSEKQAIELLKQKGYKITKEVITIQEF